MIQFARYVNTYVAMRLRANSPWALSMRNGRVMIGHSGTSLATGSVRGPAVQLANATAVVLDDGQQGVWETI